MKKTITIVDYGSGNLLSAKQSFIKAASLIDVDAEIQISNNPKNKVDNLFFLKHKEDDCKIFFACRVACT